MIDTNILLDWLLDRDPIRTKQVDRLFAQEKTFQLPDVIFIELVFALEKYYELPRDVVVQNLNKVLEEQNFTCNRPLFYAALSHYHKYPSLSFIDCYLLVYAEQQNDLPLWTFDKKLVNQSTGKAQLLR